MATMLDIRATGNINAVDRKPDVSPKISMANKMAAPMVALLRGGDSPRKEKTTNVKFDWLEDAYCPHETYAAVQLLTASTELTVPNGHACYFVAGDLIKVADAGEILRVTEVLSTSTATMTVTRTVGATVAAVVATGSAGNLNLVKIGNAQIEGWTAPTPLSVKKAEKVNYCQNFADTLSITEIQKHAALWTGKELPYQMDKKHSEHLMGIERAFLYGEASTSGETGDKDALRTTGGILEFCTSNAGSEAELTHKEFVAWINSTFVDTSSSDTKILFVSEIIARAIQDWGYSKLQLRQVDTKLGIKFLEVIVPFGRVLIRSHRMLAGKFAGYALCLDLAHLKYRFYEGMDTKIRAKDVTAVDSHIEKYEFFTVAGLEVRLPSVHGIMKDVATFA